MCLDVVRTGACAPMPNVISERGQNKHESGFNHEIEMSAAIHHATRRKILEHSVTKGTFNIIADKMAKNTG